EAGSRGRGRTTLAASSRFLAAPRGQYGLVRGAARGRGCDFGFGGWGGGDTPPARAAPVVAALARPGWRPSRSSPRAVRPRTGSPGGAQPATATDRGSNRRPRRLDRPRSGRLLPR